MYNKISLLGYVGGKPRAANENEIASFSVATSHNYKDKNGIKQNETTWHRCVAFGKIAQVCIQYLDKGSLVFVDGRIKSRKYEDSAGVSRESRDIMISNLKMIRQPGQDRQQIHPPDFQAPMPQAQTPAFDDDIPF